MEEVCAPCFSKVHHEVLAIRKETRLAEGSHIIKVVDDEDIVMGWQGRIRGKNGRNYRNMP